MKRDEIKAGALLSYLNLLIGNLIPFIYTPIMLRMLGQAEHGIYGIAQSVMGYIGLLNFGIGGSIIRYLAKYRAEGDLDGEQRVFGLFIKIYSVIGAAILLVRHRTDYTRPVHSSHEAASDSYRYLRGSQQSTYHCH